MIWTCTECGKEMEDKAQLCSNCERNRCDCRFGVGESEGGPVDSSNSNEQGGVAFHATYRGRILSPKECEMVREILSQECTQIVLFLQEQLDSWLLLMPKEPYDLLWGALDRIRKGEHRLNIANAAVNPSALEKADLENLYIVPNKPE